MSASDRLKRLKDLVDRLERLPPSADRDRLLADARGRVVDVDTGERPEPLRQIEPLPEAFMQPARPAPLPPPAAPRPARPAPDLAPPKPPAAPAAEPIDWGVRGDFLSLDDESPAPPDDESPPPWRLGLRG